MKNVQIRQILLFLLNFLDVCGFCFYFNSADGEYVVTTMTKAILYHDGNVKW